LAIFGHPSSARAVNDQSHILVDKTQVLPLIYTYLGIVRKYGTKPTFSIQRNLNFSVAILRVHDKSQYFDTFTRNDMFVQLVASACGQNYQGICGFE
jgi:hypothetical protein